MQQATREKHRQEAVDAGKNDYVTKPFKKENVLQMVQKWCSVDNNGDNGNHSSK